MFKIGDLVIGNEDHRNEVYEHVFKLYSKPHEVVDVYEEKTRVGQTHQFVVLKGYESKNYTVDEFSNGKKVSEHKASKLDIAIADFFIKKYNS